MTKKNFSTELLDELTGLYSRQLFELEIDRLQSSRGFPISILLADIDNLRVVNQVRGYEVGDALLKQAAALLRASFRKEDLIYRIEDDEFAVLLPKTDAWAADRILRRISDALHRHNKTVEYGHQLYFSVGIETVEREQNLLEGVKLAEEKMAEDKTKNKNAREQTTSVRL